MHEDTFVWWETAIRISTTARIFWVWQPGSCGRFWWIARVPLDDDVAFTGARADMVVALDEALDLLEKQDPERARILELKYFGWMLKAGLPLQFSVCNLSL